MKAALSNYRISPRKARLVADLVKGKTVAEALAHLQFLTKRASSPLAKLIKSAAANAANNAKLDPATLVVADVRVDKGVVLKRMMPRAFGRAAGILKRSSHISVTLAPAKPAAAKKKK